jgi:hypothetical protein
MLDTVVVNQLHDTIPLFWHVTLNSELEVEEGTQVYFFSPNKSQDGLTV